MVLGLTLWIKTKNFLEAALVSGLVMAGGLVLALPFILNFKNIAGGVALVDFHTPAWMIGVLWGVPLLTTILAGGMFVWGKKEKIDYWVMAVLGVSWFLIILPEIIYVKDIYVHDYQRANTMFKLTYQAFVMFAVTGGYIITKSGLMIKSWVVKIGAVLIIAGVLYFVGSYPVYAVKSYYGLKNYRSLDGLEYLKNQRPDDYRAVLWLNKYVTGQPVIVEAVGESYTDYARISANTGLPTILGWRVHEWLWRGSFDEPGKRTTDVADIYQFKSKAQLRTLLEQYKVKYIVIGDMERLQYTQMDEKALEGLGEVVFKSGKTEIVEVVNE